MQVNFFYNFSDARTINKNLQAGETFSGVARDAANILSPVIIFDTDQVLKYNYAYIPEFQRYYSLVDKTVYRQGLFTVTFAVDVLMSFKGHILQLPAVVDKQSMPENGDEYIDDSSLVTDNLMFTTVYNYPDGFNNTPELILITAG